jgi:hypothetical protein
MSQDNDIQIARAAWTNGFQTALKNLSKALDVPQSTVVLTEEAKTKLEEMFEAWWWDYRTPTSMERRKQRKILFNMLRTLVEAKDNTRELLSMAEDHLDLEVPTYEEIIDLYNSIEGKEVSGSESKG